MEAKIQIWIRGLLAAIITGASGGILTGFAAIGLKPDVFNLAAGFKDTMHIGLVAAALHSIIGVATYLQKSPLPD